jgi:hypothetical protein
MSPTPSSSTTAALPIKWATTFATREAAHGAAARAAREQRTPGQGGPIEYEDSSGRWREEEEKGDDRPDTEVKD